MCDIDYIQILSKHVGTIHVYNIHCKVKYDV